MDGPNLAARRLVGGACGDCQPAPVVFLEARCPGADSVSAAPEVSEGWIRRADSDDGLRLAREALLLGDQTNIR
jgi:hypothetical protein